MKKNPEDMSFHPRGSTVCIILSVMTINEPYNQDEVILAKI